MTAVYYLLKKYFSIGDSDVYSGYLNFNIVHMMFFTYVFLSDKSNLFIIEKFPKFYEFPVTGNQSTLKRNNWYQL